MNRTKNSDGKFACDMFLKVFSDSYGQWVKDLKQWIATSNCQKKTITSMAWAHAYAIAEVMVSAATKVSCSDHGYACGWAAADGGALASNVAKAVARAFVDADPSKEHLGTFCHADVEALGEVLAEVSEEARAFACQSGAGSKSQWVDRFKREVECAVVQAYTRAAAKYCQGT